MLVSATLFTELGLRTTVHRTKKLASVQFSLVGFSMWGALQQEIYRQKIADVDC